MDLSNRWHSEFPPADLLLVVTVLWSSNTSLQTTMEGCVCVCVYLQTRPFVSGPEPSGTFAQIKLCVCVGVCVGVCVCKWIMMGCGPTEGIDNSLDCRPWGRAGRHSAALTLDSHITVCLALSHPALLYRLRPQTTIAPPPPPTFTPPWHQCALPKSLPFGSWSCFCP